MINGLRCNCPNCGETSLSQGFTTVKDSCDNCSQELSHHRADDLPPYLIIFIVGHIVLSVLMVSMKYNLFEICITAIGGSLIAVIIALALMRSVKGMIVGLQWALRMHGFDKSL
ncbi:MAG: DUF983 domain-containing protein [Hyphomicrobiales bacterium]|nr:DUF983 domain-containing protein [Hyphomicrobiales bacterium]